MNWQVAVAALRRELLGVIDVRLGHLFGFSLTAKSSAMGTEDEVQTDDEGKGQRPARRLEPWGLRGFPVSKSRSFWIRLGSSNVLFVGIAPSKGYGPSDLLEGETALYSKEIPKGVHLTDAGDNKLASKDGRTVQVNGADYFMAKWEPFATVLAAFAGSLAGITTPTTLAEVITAIGVVKTASTTLQTAMGTNSNYKSTKAKNG